MRTVWWIFTFVAEIVCLRAGLKLCDGYIVGADVRFFAVFTGDCPLQFVEGDVEFNGYLIVYFLLRKQCSGVLDIQRLYRGMLVVARALYFH